MAISTHTRSFDELLDTVKTVQDLKEVFKKNPYTKFWIDKATNNQFLDFNIDDLVIPKYEYHRSLAGALMLSRSTTNFVDGLLMNPKVAISTKKKQYVALVQMLCIEEAALFRACLVKDIATLYPILTHEFMGEALTDEA